MRIGIDARMMSPKATRGIGRYTEELIRAMLALAPEHEYLLVTRHPLHPFASHPSVQTVVADISWYGLREQLRMPSILCGLKADVIHVPHWNVPVAFDGPLVITIHDLLLRHEPMSARISTHSPIMAGLKRFGYRVALLNAIHHARVILAPTHFTADDLGTLYPSARSKIVVTGEGMGHGKRHLTPPAAEHPASDYLFYVGSAYPHKQLDVLLDAWADIEVRYPGLKLKIASADDVFLQRLKDRVYKEKYHRVEFLGYVSEQELARLYRDALAFVFPSRFEGFGLPPLEALEAGCPVICSDAAALPEVLGSESAFFFKSGSKTGILRAVETVLADPVAARRKVVDALPALHARHDWNTTAHLTLDAYQTLLPSCPPGNRP